MVKPVSRVKMTHSEEVYDSERAISSIESPNMVDTFPQHARRVQLDYGPSDLKHASCSSGAASSNGPPGAEVECRADSRQLNNEPLNVPPKCERIVRVGIGGIKESNNIFLFVRRLLQLQRE